MESIAVFWVVSIVFAYAIGIWAERQDGPQDANKIADFFENQAVKYEKKSRSLKDSYMESERKEFKLIAEDCWSLAERVRIHSKRE